MPNVDSVSCWLGLLLERLASPSLTPHTRAWILAQLHDLTDLHDPYVQRFVLGGFERTVVSYSPEGGAWLLTSHMDATWPTIDETLQVEFAQRWKHSARGFVIEHVDAAPPK